jgi:hypothetical protein
MHHQQTWFADLKNLIDGILQPGLHLGRPEVVN